MGHEIDERYLVMQMKNEITNLQEFVSSLKQELLFVKKENEFNKELVKEVLKTRKSKYNLIGTEKCKKHGVLGDFRKDTKDVNYIINYSSRNCSVDVTYVPVESNEGEKEPIKWKEIDKANADKAIIYNETTVDEKVCNIKNIKNSLHKHLVNEHVSKEVPVIQVEENKDEPEINESGKHNDAFDGDDEAEDTGDHTSVGYEKKTDHEKDQLEETEIKCQAEKVTKEVDKENQGQLLEVLTPYYGMKRRNSLYRSVRADKNEKEEKSKDSSHPSEKNHKVVDYNNMSDNLKDQQEETEIECQPQEVTEDVGKENQGQFLEVLTPYYGMQRRNSLYRSVRPDKNEKEEKSEDSLPPRNTKESGIPLKEFHRSYSTPMQQRNQDCEYELKCESSCEETNMDDNNNTETDDNCSRCSLEKDQSKEETININTIKSLNDSSEKISSDENEENKTNSIEGKAFPGLRRHSYSNAISKKKNSLQIEDILHATNGDAKNGYPSLTNQGYEHNDKRTKENNKRNQFDTFTRKNSKNLRRNPMCIPGMQCGFFEYPYGDRSPNINGSDKSLDSYDPRASAKVSKTQEANMSDNIIVTINGEKRTIDMQMISPYLKCIYHGGRQQVGEEMHDIIVFVANFLPPKRTKNYKTIMEQLFFYCVHTTDLLVKDAYKIVFFNSSAHNKNMPGNKWIKKYYDMIFYRLRKSLRGIYFVHQSLWLKTALKFSRIFLSSNCRKKIHLIQNIQDLQRHIPLEYMFIPQNVWTIDETFK